MHNDGDTLEDYYKRAHLDETRRSGLNSIKHHGHQTNPRFLKNGSLTEPPSQ